MWTRREWLTLISTGIPASLGLATTRVSGPRTPRVSDDCAAIERRIGGRLGVVVLDEHGSTRLAYRPGERFSLCSTFKLLAVSAVLTRVDAGTEQLARRVPYGEADLLDYAPITHAHVADGHMSVEALCDAAIIYSDNTAANLLLRTLDGPAGVTRYIRSIGDPTSRLDRYEPALNSAEPNDPRDTTTPEAMAADARALLLSTRLLSTSSRERLTTWMIANTTGADLLRAGLPGTWRAGDKTGSGAHGSLNDVAVVWPPNRPALIVAAYSVGSTAATADRRAAIARVGALVASF